VLERSAGSYRVSKDFAPEYKDEEILFKMVWWKQDGGIFQAGVPANWAQEEIEKYCVAKRVEVKQG
jgi:hypothetical protein